MKSSEATLVSEQSMKKETAFMTENNKTNYLFIINDGPYGNERPYNARHCANLSCFAQHVEKDAQKDKQLTNGQREFIASTNRI